MELTSFRWTLEKYLLKGLFLVRLEAGSAYAFARNESLLKI